MKTIIYKTQNNSSQRKIKTLLEEGNIEYIERNISQYPMSEEEFFDIITKHRDGIESLLSRSSKKIIGDLLDKGIDVEELSLTEFHGIVVKHPNILKSPITVHGDIVLDGYNRDEVRVLIPEGVRKAEMKELLKTARLNEAESYAISNDSDVSNEQSNESA